ncbi:F-box and associated interaction domain protein [Medicago truncatula]|uniref:F-box and associated interaction domain protein n=1 Tax=Medicago truncatula TaxID=3880 RepID=G7J3S8_MEDTR|nr:F-box and associated interaction domain protein [Medicago truncatula]
MAKETTELPCTVQPAELMIEILLRVESDNPLQLRCVCKLWKSLLVDPQFMENHILRPTTNICDLLNKTLEHYHTFKL